MIRILSLICFLTLCSSTFATIDMFRKLFDKNAHSKSNAHYVPVDTSVAPMQQLQPQPHRHYYQPAAYNSYSNAAVSQPDTPKNNGKFSWFTKLKPWSSSSSSSSSLFPVSDYAPSAGYSSYYPQSSYGNSPMKQFPVGDVFLQSQSQPQPQPQPQPPLQPKYMRDRLSNLVPANNYADFGAKQNYGSTGFVAYYTIPVSDAFPLQPKQIIIGNNNDRTGAETDKVLVAEEIFKKNHPMNCD